MDAKDVEEIKKMVMDGTHPVTIAHIYGVSITVIYDIIDIMYDDDDDDDLTGNSEDYSPFQTINS